MDLEAVRTFTAAADADRFQDAAAELSITQQAVSKRIAALEKDLGVRLFTRTARGGRLTIDGQAFLPHARALLQAEERGSPVANALEIQAGAARIRRANLAENAASDMKGKIVLPTMMIVGVSMMLIAVPSAMLIDKMAGGFH